MSTTPQSALRFNGVSKAYPGTQALSEVSFGVEPGHIHALLGCNGSGKSTLVKVLAGVVQADAGRIEVGGVAKEAASVTPGFARSQGLHFVHQQNSTFPELSVAENLAAGSGFTASATGRIRWRAVRGQVRETLERFEIPADPDQRMGSLGPAVQMMVTIARALQGQDESRRGTIVLDEPTAALAAPQVRVLLDALRKYAADGQTIVYVTHRLEEVLEVTDRVTVLRNGAVVDSVETAGLTHDALVELILGRAVARTISQPAPPAGSGDAALQVSGLRGGSVRGADFEVAPGEIVGLAGIQGSGKSSILRMLFGGFEGFEGTVRMGGQTLKLRRPADAMKAGVAYVPEDRLADAAFAQMTVAENLSAARVGAFWNGGVLSRRSERRDAEAVIGDLSIEAAGPGAPFASLSGGNQQRVILARWLKREPRLLLLDEPTQGIDVGARAEIYEIVRRVAAGGTSVLVASSDFEELCDLCSRILVLVRGRVVGEFQSTETSADQLHELALSKGAE